MKTALPTDLTPDLRDSSILALEESNASLAARIGELEAELVMAQDECNHLRTARDRAAEEMDAARGDGLALPSSSFGDEMRRTRRALEITALASLHVESKALGVAHERCITAALRLGDELAAEVEAAP